MDRLTNRGTERTDRGDCTESLRINQGPKREGGVKKNLYGTCEAGIQHILRELKILKKHPDIFSHNTFSIALRKESFYTIVQVQYTRENI